MDSLDTTSQMWAYLQQLGARVAEAEAQGNRSVSDDEGDGPDAARRGTFTYPLRFETRTVSYTNGDTYEGDMLGDQRHGTGTHTTSTGDTYSGGWSLDRRHGQGTFKTAAGMVYEGSWVDDKACGSGRCTYPDGSKYTGDWECDERSGWGKLETADGQVYEGEWQGDKPHGEGQWVFADGLSSYRGTYRAGQRVEGRLVLFDSATKKPAHTYTGRFKNDMRHGPDGVGVEEGLWEYRGDWQEDLRWGQGRCRFADGSVYEGEWERDIQQGSGCMVMPDGTKYEGQWQQGKLHGVGKVKYASGETYVGHWQNGQKHGHGKWSSAPKPGAQSNAAKGSSSKTARDTYVGSWFAGKREGKGVAEFADGSRYEGDFKADRRHGQGLMVFADGLVFRGAWEEDEWLQSAAEPALCSMSGPGLTAAAAGQRAEFVIQARDELSNPRLNGGDTFLVLLVPTCKPSNQSRLLTAPAAALAAADFGTNSHMPLAAAQLDSSRSSASSFDACSSSSSSSGASVGMEAYLKRPAAPAVVEAVAAGDVQDNGDGTYSCSYTHNTVGVYELHVTNGQGEHVAGSPCKVVFSPGAPSARHSIVSGPGRRAATAGCRAEFSIVLKDSHGNCCEAVQLQQQQQGGTASAADAAASAGIEARLIGSNSLTAACVEVTPQSNGSLCCSYVAPTVPGLYVLEVLAGGKHVGGSPFSVKVSAAGAGPLSLSATAEARASSSCASEATGTLVNGLHAAAAMQGNSTTSTPSTNSSSATNSISGDNKGATSGSGSGDTSKGDTSKGEKASAAVLQDKLRWWGDIAKQAYEAIDGSLLGFEAAASGDDAAQTALPGMSSSEAEMVKANPNLPVVEHFEDLWLLSKLQQERKAKQQQEQHAKHQQEQKQKQQHAKQQQQSNTSTLTQTAASSQQPVAAAVMDGSGGGGSSSNARGSSGGAQSETGRSGLYDLD